MEKKQEVAVSILCVTYNHKDFIAKALDGFLMQKTNFPYEIVVHDDASTDGTREILLQYQERYPDKIRLILQDENQFSKGKRILLTFLFPEIRGKYVALCDGDDEWIYEGKLQEQYNLMESHSEVSLCIHNAVQRNFESECDIYQINGLEEGVVEEREIFITTKGRIPTTSFFFRAECVDDYPQFNSEAPVGDDPLRFHCALKGDIYYIDKVWCIRNFMHEGSWNYGMKDKRKKLIYAKRFLRYLYNYKIYANGRFCDPLKELMIDIAGVALCSILPEKYNICILQESIMQLEEETGYLFSEIFQEIYHYYERNCTNYNEVVLSKFLEDCKKAKGRLYIYGAGIEAKKYAEIVEEKNISFEGFVVTSGHFVQDIYLDYPLYSLNALSEDVDKIYFLLGLNMKNRREVEKLLRERGYEHFI